MRNLLYSLIFLEGATVMTVELLGARMIAPAYGTSLPVWTVVLSLAVGALAAGYRMGGKWAEKSKIITLFTLLIAAACAIAIMPWFANKMISAMYGLSFWISLLICAAVFIMPALFLLGSTTPIVTKLLSADASAEGSSAGKVFGVSTIGGIAGTFITGFFLIPSFGLTNTAIGAAIILGIVPAVLLFEKKEVIYSFVFIGAIGFALWFSLRKTSSEEVKVLYHSEGLLGQLIVADIPRDLDTAKGYERVMFVNRTGQTWIDRSTGRSRWEYVGLVSSVASAVKKEPEVLLLGLGGGTVARSLVEEHKAKVDAIELDERISLIAKTYFDLPPSVNIINDDARHFIRTAQKKYDIVIFDVFGGEVPPAHALTLESFTSVNHLLNKGGFVLINFNGFIKGKAGKPGRSICKTLYKSGFEVLMLRTPGPESSRNMIYLAFRGSEGVNFAYSPEVRVEGKPTINLDSLFIHPPGSIDLKDAEILTDNYPVLELMNLPASLAWRKGYREYAKALNAKGVKVFE